MRQTVSALYWLAGVTIGLGAFGHGIGGARAIEAGLRAGALAADVTALIWVVWYFVSGAMLVFSGTVIWSWFAARRGVRGAFIPAALVGVLYLVFGLAAFWYRNGDRFWLLFVVQAVLVLGAIPVLRASPRPDVR